MIISNLGKIRNSVFCIDWEDRLKWKIWSDYSSRKLFPHTSAVMCSTCLSGQGRRWCHVIWSVVTAPREPTEMSVVPRGFLFMPAFGKTPGVALFHTAGSGKCWQMPVYVYRQVRRPQVDHISPPGDWFLQILATFSASSRIMTNAKKLSTICSVGGCSTWRDASPILLKIFILFHSEMHFITVKMLFCFTPPRLDR